MAKNNLYVFERKEILILVILLILVALFAFTLGVKLGRDLQVPPQMDGSTDTTSGSMEMELGGNSGLGTDPSPLSGKKKEIMPTDSTQPVKVDPSGLPGMTAEVIPTAIPVRVKKVVPEAQRAGDPSQSEPRYDKTGSALGEKIKPEPRKKDPNPIFVLQESSHRTYAEALKQKNFLQKRDMDGKSIPARVVQKTIPGKGVWYRVTIGAFQSRNEATAFRKEFKKVFPDLSPIVQTLD